MESKQRDDGLDIIRSIAVIFVPSIHFYAHSGFYSRPIEGVWMLLAEVFRTFFITCVPLFCLLTGYLQRDTKVEKKYYFRLIRIVLAYILCGILCQIYICVHDGGKSFKSILLSFFDFSACQYAWYIEMYMGLYLLIPFLNILWKNLDGKMRKTLLISLLIITGLPSVVCTFNFNSEIWWQSIQTNYSQFAVEYWINIYPITYFFVGRYLAENSDKLCGRVKFWMLLLAGGVFGTINFFKNWHVEFPWNQDTSYAGYQCMIMSVLIFGFLMKKTINKKVIKNLFRIISMNSLAIYVILYR